MRSLLLTLACATSLEAQWRLDRIASTAGDDQMGSPTAMVVGRSGEIYVADAKGLNIVVYDSLGRRSRTIGRSGEGPGEFQRFGGMAWLGDTLAVYDWRLRRISLLRHDGSAISTDPWRAAELPNQLLGAGGSSLHVLAYGRGQDVPIPGINGTRRIRPSKTFYRLGSDGSLNPVSLPTLAADPDVGHDCWNDPRKAVYWTDNEPGGQGPFNAFTTTGAFVYTTPDRTGLRWRSGREEIQIPYAPLSVTDAIWRREAAEHFELEQKIGKLTCSPPLDRPAALPAIRGIVADDRGGIWVEVTTASGSRFDVYDAERGLIASVDAPLRRFEGFPFVVRGDRLYLPVKDTDDVVSISVYRLRR